MCGTTPGSVCSLSCARTFGLPLTISGTTPISVREVPCALKPHVHDGVSRKILGSLSEHGCQWNFLDWVNNYRPYDSGIEDDELKMCPMIWCRKTFETKILTIRHVFDCPCLSNAWYWCPYHKRPERFLECNKGREIIRKPKLHQAASFFNWFGGRRSLKRQTELQSKVLMDEYQRQTYLEELGTGTDNQRFESPGSNSQSSESSHSAMMAGWVDEKASCRRRQSRIAEVYGDVVCFSELPASHKSVVRPEMYDPSAPPTEMPIPGSRQQRSSPELFHPVNSEPDRDSLWQKRRGTPAADRCHSGAKQEAISSSSRGSSKPDSSLHSVAVDGDEVPASAMSHPVSSNTVAPTGDSVSNFVFPGSPNSGLAPSSNMFSPVSPIAQYAYPPSNLDSPVIVTRNDPGSGTIEHHDEAANGWISFGLSPPQSMPKKPDNTRSTLKSPESGLPILRPVPLHSFNCSSEFEESDAPLVSVQPRQSRVESSDVEGFTHTDCFDESSELEATSSLIESISPFASPQRNACMESGFLTEGDISSPAQGWFDLSDSVHSSLSAPPTAAIHASSFSEPLIRPSTLVTRMSTNQAGTGDSDTWEGPLGKREGDWKMEEQGAETESFHQSDEEQSLACLNLQLWSPLDNLITTFMSELNSTCPQGYSNDGRQQLAAQNHSGGIASSQVLATKTLPHCFNHKSFLVSNSPLKQVQVEELQELVRTINTEWMQRMTLLPELWSRCSALPAPILFKKAVWTLKEYICGRSAQIFEDVFAFIHLAFASAFLLHWQHDFYSWHAFFNEALQWQHAIADKEDKVLYLKAMNCYWLPELEASQLLSSSRHTSFCNITPQGSFHFDDQKTLSDVSRNSEVFKVCIGLLDRFEEADIGERNAHFPSEALAFHAQSRTRKIQHMIKNITRPLLQERGIEALQRIVIDTEYQIHCGLLQNTREVEITLITSGRWSSESPEVLERFHDSVTSQCDEAMLSSGSDRYSGWRNDHYIDDVDRILKISELSDGQPSNESAGKHWPDAGVLAVIHRNQPILDSPNSLSSTSDGAGANSGASTSKESGSLNSSPTSLMSWTSTGSSQTLEVSSQTTSPNTMLQESVSPTSPVSTTPTTSVASCRACSIEFKGSPQDATSNYRRHLRTSRRHNRKTGLKCPLPECREKGPMRTDNLGPHLHNVHKMSSSSARQSVIEKSKLSARRVDSDGVARRRSGRE